MTKISKSNTISFREQLKRFFSHKFSTPFMIICLGVIVVGAMHAGHVVSNLKQDIETKIVQQKEELNKLLDIKDQEREDNYRVANANYEKCWNEYHARYKCGFDPGLLYSPSSPRVESDYLYDASYRELDRIKKTSSFQLFFENFDFGWWGVIALVLVFFINIIILLYKLTRMYIPRIFRYGNAQTKSIKTNMHGMAPFQRYSVTLLVIILLALVIIALAIIF